MLVTRVKSERALQIHISAKRSIKTQNIESSHFFESGVARSNPPMHDFPRRVKKILGVLYNRGDDLTRPSTA